MEDTRVFRSADVGSDHHLVCTAVKIRLRKQDKEKECERVRYDLDNLKDTETARKFNIAVRNMFQVLENEALEVEQEEVEKKFRVMQTVYTESAEEVLGRPRKKKKKKPLINEASWKLVDAKEKINKKIHSTHSERLKGQLKDKYKEKDREVKRSLKADKKKWVDNIASDAEEAARSQHMKTLHGLTKTLCNERPRQSAAVLDKNCTLISGKTEILSRWTEHFQEALNRDEPHDTITEDEEIDLEELIEDISVNGPSKEEVQTAIKRLRNGKSQELIQSRQNY